MQARAIRRKYKYDEENKSQVVQLKEVVRKSGLDVFEKLTNNPFYYKNWYYNGGKEKFPHAPSMQFVERYYPYAEGGPMAFDEIGPLDDVETYKLKKIILEKSGIRYVILTHGITEHEAMEQLA
jgi:hypothetical protein